MITTPKVWYPLESSPDVFNSMAKCWGLDDRYHFEDILSLDEDYLASISRPVHAIILLFPDTPEIVRRRIEQDDSQRLASSNIETRELPLWIPQVDVGHACGTFALVHSLAQTGLCPGLKDFFKACKAATTPEGRTKLFSESEEIHRVHSAHVAAGQTLVRGYDEEEPDHFIAFVSSQIEGKMHLFEMDGAPPSNGPIDRGVIGPAGLLMKAAQVVKELYIPAAGDNVHFSMMALVG